MSESFSVDLRKSTPEEIELRKHQAQLIFELNQTMPYTEKYQQLLQSLFGDRLGEGAVIHAPLTCVCADMVSIGKRVVIMNNCLMMARGGITIDDDVMIAANAQLISNNHDLHERQILLCNPVHICKNAWIGAGATILPGVTIGENAVVGACSVVTKDVAPNTIVVGNPAKCIKTIDA
ncbi:MAG: galactoside O-acetyltransferase [Proteobacteria bacterium]|jgi:acetyltransferase-like isoleucine patch superfamily enzyme|nr:galactoside O-acetyltransferase [Pseudomonadota bacterium]